MIRAGSLLLAVKFAAVGISFLVNILLSRYYGADAYGVFAYVISISNLIVFAATAGMDTYLKKTVAVEGIESQSVIFARRQSVLINFLAVALLLIPSWILLVRIDMESNVFIVLILMLFISFLSTQKKILSGLLIGARKPIIEGFISQLLFHIFFLLLVGGFLLAFPTINALQSSKSTPSIFLAYLIATFSAVLALSVVYRKHSNSSDSVISSFPTVDLKLESIKQSYRDTTGLIKLSIPFALLSTTTILERNLDVIMIGLFSTSSEVAVYFACTRITALFLFTLFAMNAIASPMVASAYAKKETKKLQKTVSTVTKVSGSVASILVVLVAFLGSYALELFNLNTDIGYKTLMVLAIGNVIRTWMGPVFMVASMAGLEKPAFRISLQSLFFNFVLNLVLIPFFGIIGAAIATTTTRIWRSYTASKLVYAETNIHTGFSFPRTKC